MSPQADYVVANASGSAFRADLNNQLAAIVANNSGATEPATMYAFQWWVDTTTGTLKLRNASNNAWVTIGTLASTNLGLLSLAGGTMTGALVAALGTSSVPGISFTGDLDTGLSAAAANTLVLSTNGTARLTASTTAVTSSLPIDVPLGSVGAPSLTFTGDLDTGILSPSANQLAIATNGVERVEFGTTEVVFNDGGADVDFRVEGDTNADLFKIDAGLDQVQVANLNGGPLAGFRNVIINGNPTINQRGYVSGAATSGANQYTLDRWRVVTSGQNISFTDSANVRTVTAPAGGCEQVVEGLSILSGTYTLNWTGTATATVGGTAVAKGGNVTLTGGTNATVKFSSGTFSLVQLEPGPVATPFEQRSIGTELALCQRYYEQWAGTHIGSGYVVLNGSNPGGNNGAFAQVFFKVTKRTTPNVTGVVNYGTAPSGDANAHTISFNWAADSVSVATRLSAWTASAEL
jgi:hypothetical protein